MLDDAGERARFADALRGELATRTEILFAYLHGSFLTGGPFRDVDVAIWVDPGQVSQEQWLPFAIDLAVDLRLALGVAVDVQVLNGASLAFRYHALDGRALLVRDEALRVDVVARTWDDYLDFQPFARRYLLEVLT
jgi:predicted nucleotidyltransferase